MRILFILFFSILFVSCSSDNKSERKQINEILAKGEKITNYENLSLEDSKEVSQKNSIKFSKFNKYKNWTHTNYNYTSNIGIRNFNLNYQVDKSKKVLSKNIFFNNNKIIILNQNGTINILDENLKLIKKYKFKFKKSKNFVLNFNAAVAENSLIISDNLGYIRKINLENGKIVWEKFLSVPFVSNLIIYKNKIYTLNINSKIFSFSMLDGNQDWSFETASTLFNTPQAFRIVVSNDILIFSNNAGQLTAINLNNYKLLWQRDLRKFTIFSANKIFEISNLIIDKQAVFLSSNYGETLAFDYKTGKNLWSKKFYLNDIILSNKYVFGINTNGYFVIMQKQNGKIIFSKFLKDKKKRKIIPIKILLNKTNILISTNLNKSLLLELNNLSKLDYKKIRFDQYMHTLNHTFLLNKNRVLRIN